MTDIRTIILVDGSRLLREMLRRVIEKTEGLQVVAEVAYFDQLANEINEHHPDWVILFQLSVQDIPNIVQQLLRENRDLRIAILSSSGNQVRMKWIEYHDEVLLDLTWEALTQSLREDRAAQDGNNSDAGL